VRNDLPPEEEPRLSSLETADNQFRGHYLGFSSTDRDPNKIRHLTRVVRPHMSAISGVQAQSFSEHASCDGSGEAGSDGRATA